MIIYILCVCVNLVLILSSMYMLSKNKIRYFAKFKNAFICFFNHTKIN